MANYRDAIGTVIRSDPDLLSSAAAVRLYFNNCFYLTLLFD